MILRGDVMPRVPESSNIRALKNDKRHAHRYKDIEALKPSEDRPVAPEHLSERAKEIFNEFVARIEEMYSVSNTDMDILVLYANNKEQLEYLESILRDEGVTYEVGNMYGVTLKPRPEVAIHKDCKTLHLAILKEFGLSPSARNRIKMKPKEKKKENPFAAISKKVNE